MPSRFLPGHNNRKESHRSWNGGKTIQKDGTVSLSGYKGFPRASDHGTIREHNLIAQNVFGKSLPEKAVVHHVDGNPSNNKNSNLVICEDQAYHLLLHQRSRSFKSCGNANFRKCVMCKQYDDIANMVLSRKQQYVHVTCRSEYHKAYRLKKKNGNN